MTVVEEHKIYPITVLPSLSRDALVKFAQKKVILLRDVLPYSAEELKKEFGIDAHVAVGIKKEAHAIFKSINKENKGTSDIQISNDKGGVGVSVTSEYGEDNSPVFAEDSVDIEKNTDEKTKNNPGDKAENYAGEDNNDNIYNVTDY